MWTAAPVNKPPGTASRTAVKQDTGNPVWVQDPNSGGEGGGTGYWTGPTQPLPGSGGEGGGAVVGPVVPPPNSQGGEGGSPPSNPTPGPAPAPAPPSAADAEAARQRSAIDRINDLYKGRDGIYSGAYKNAYELQKKRLDENRELVLRKIRFNMARSGLAGGSENVTQNAMENRTFSRALADSSNAAQSQADTLKAADEKQRLNLISMIRSGMDEGDATQAALAGMSNQVNEAMNWNNYDAVQAYMSALSPIAANWQKQQTAQDAALQYANRYGRLPAGYYGRVG